MMMHEETNGHGTVEVIETLDENGQAHYFEKMDEVDHNGTRYALMLYHGETAPAGLGFGDDESDDETLLDAEANDEGEGYEEEFVLMRIMDDGDGDVYEAIEDEEEFNTVLALFESMDYEIDVDDALPELQEDARGTNIN
ncbi:MAG: DUF1292 domain-containing protein [Vampirovibrionales bacterium]